MKRGGYLFITLIIVVGIMLNIPLLILAAESNVEDVITVENEGIIEEIPISDNNFDDETTYENEPQSIEDIEAPEINTDVLFDEYSLLPDSCYHIIENEDAGDEIDNLTANTEAYLWPVPSSKTLSRGYSSSHTGLDIVQKGDNISILATKSGTVIRVYSGCGNTNGAGSGSGCSKSTCVFNNPYKMDSYGGKYFCNYGYGNGVIIKHSDGSGYSMYAHMSSVSVKTNQSVKQGDVLGTMGSTGCSTGQHLHFELCENVKTSGNYDAPVNSINNNTSNITYIDKVKSEITFSPRPEDEIIESTNATLTQWINATNTVITASGVILYNGTGTIELGRAYASETDKTQVKSKFNLNNKIMPVTTITPNTSYKYKFYADDKNGKRYESKIYSFTTLAGESPVVNFSDITPQIGTDNAILSHEISVKNGTITRVYAYIMEKDSNGKYYDIGYYEEDVYVTSSVKKKYDVANQFWLPDTKTNGVKLLPGKIYYYKFYARVEGVQDKFKGPVYTIVTASTTTPEINFESIPPRVMDRNAVISQTISMGSNNGAIRRVYVYLMDKDSSGNYFDVAHYEEEIDPTYSITLKYDISKTLINDSSGEVGYTLLPGKTYYYKFHARYVGADSKSKGPVYQFTTPADSVAVNGVTLNKTAKTFNVGKTESLSATISPSNATNKAVTWTSSNTNIATVTGNGVVTAKAVGTAIITVKTNDGGKTAGCTVTIIQPVTGVKLNKNELKLVKDQIETLSATITPSNATNKKLIWTTTDASVAKVSDNGLVTAVGKGRCKINASSSDGAFSASCTVTVIESVKELITVSYVSDGSQIFIQQVEKNKLAGKPNNPVKDGYVFSGWYSDADLINKYDFSVPVTSDITLYAGWVQNNAEQGLTIVAGQAIDIKECCFEDVDSEISRYVVDNKNYASVSKGMLIGKKAGAVTVKAQLKTGKNTYEDVAYSEVYILNKPKLRFAVPMTYEGQSIDASESFTTTDTSIVGATMWESSNPQIVEVTDDTAGLLTAHGKGTAKITAYFGEKGKKGTLKVSANVAVKIPAFTKQEYTLQTGAKLTIGMKNVTVALNPEWVAESSDVIYVSPVLNSKGQANGKVIIEGLEAGDTMLTAWIDDQPYSCTIHVSTPMISKSSMNLTVGKSGVVSLKQTRIKKQDIVWETSDPSVVTVGDNGKITALSKGSATVYTTAGGVLNECIVTVE